MNKHFSKEKHLPISFQPYAILSLLQEFPSLLGMQKSPFKNVKANETLDYWTAKSTMCKHPWLWKDCGLRLVLKYQVPFTSLMKPKPQKVAEPPSKEINVPLFLFWQNSFCLIRAQHQQWMLLHPHCRNQNKDGYGFQREGKLLQASPL